MGTDNIHHKRKAKTALNRASKKQRKPYERVLIVCEGKKTEPIYFECLIKALRLATANVVVDGDCGSSPDRVFKHAKKLYKKSNEIGNSYDKVFCVFDKDSHPSYMATIDAINRSTPKGIFVAINSIPCFEYWLLLHFEYSIKPYAKSGKKSIADMVLTDLKKQPSFKKYQKGDISIFDKTFHLIEKAKSNSKLSLSESLKNNTDNPSTYVHILVDYLQNLKN